MEEKENPESHKKRKIFNPVKIEANDYESENGLQTSAEVGEFKEEKYKTSVNFSVSADNIEEVRAEDMFVTVNDLVTIKEEITDDVQPATEFTEASDYPANPSGSILDDQALWCLEKQDSTGKKYYHCQVCNKPLPASSEPETCEKCYISFRGNKSKKLQHETVQMHRKQLPNNLPSESRKPPMNEVKIKREPDLSFPAFKCEVCYVVFKDLDVYTKHVIVNTESFPFKCETCYREFPLQCHRFTTCTNEDPYTIVIKEDEEIYRCNVCQKEFKDIERFKIHQIYHKNKVYSCPLCPKEWRQTVEFRDHLCYKINGVVYTNEICSKKYAEVHDLKSLCSDLADPKPYVCGLCSERFICKMDLLNHIRYFENGDNVCIRRIREQRSKRKSTSKINS